MIWNRVPKGTYVGFRQFGIGVRDAVSHFNVGNVATTLGVLIFAGTNFREFREFRVI